MKGCVCVRSCRKRHTNKNGEKEQRSRVQSRDTQERQRDRHKKGKTDIPGGKGNRHSLKR